MKKQSNHLLATLSEADLVSLATEVKEVLEPGSKKIQGRFLSAADLWNIQRQRRPRVQRRFI